jgi:hypothetical protein
MLEKRLTEKIAFEYLSSCDYDFPNKGEMLTVRKVRRRLSALFCLNFFLRIVLELLRLNGRHDTQKQHSSSYTHTYVQQKE